MPADFEILFEEKIKNVLGHDDPAHDLLHVKRVVKLAQSMSEIYGAQSKVVLPAAWLHDIVNLPKDHQDRKKASALAADEAILFLESIHYEQKYFSQIHHAISSHSFSANIKPETIEAQIVQDADRLDALGAVGLARLFTVSAQLKRPFYNQHDPLASSREWDDKKFAIDHIYIKLEKISHLMNTEWASVEAKKRFEFIKQFLNQLHLEM